MKPLQESKEKIDITSLDEDLDKSTSSDKIIDSSLDRVIELTRLMGKDTNKALDMINIINRKTEFLAINALIEASRTGESGKGFQVVAESIDVLAQKTKDAVEKMRNETIFKMDDLCKIIQNQLWNIKGQRLSDLALTNMDLIDRNLFERAADIRWWATDDILVNALTNKTHETATEASKRLKKILKSYTVYFDLLLLDENGIVIANGLPEQFPVTGHNLAHKKWFEQSMRTKNGDEYGFQEVHKSTISGKYTVTFSCKIHEAGDLNKKVIGVIASVLNWDNLAQKIVNEVPLNEDEKTKSRVCIVDDDGNVLADTNNKILSEKISFPKINELFAKQKGYLLIKQKNGLLLAAHGLSPGYEKYFSNWHCIILYDINMN